MKLDADSPNAIGPLTEMDVQLRLGLEDYPAAGSKLVPFKIRWKECSPYKFIAPSIPHATYRIGDEAAQILVGQFE